jgi:hypothetical protein
MQQKITMTLVLTLLPKIRMQGSCTHKVHRKMNIDLLTSFKFVLTGLKDLNILLFDF